MTAPHTDDRTTAFRAALVEHVNTHARPRRRPWIIAGGATALALFAGTAAAAATGLLALPGSTEVTPISDTNSSSSTGTRTIDLGPAPSDATGIAVSLHCLTPGTFTLSGGTGLTCTASDFEEKSPVPGFDSYVIPLTAAADGRLTVTASDDSRWEITATYASTRSTDWGVNASGETFGVENDSGSPDLIAAIATNGVAGYVRRDDLAEASRARTAEEWAAGQATRSIPVFDESGRNPVGTFEVE
jgi:hypothetical protein